MLNYFCCNFNTVDNELQGTVTDSNVPSMRHVIHLRNESCVSVSTNTSGAAAAERISTSTSRAEERNVARRAAIACMRGCVTAANVLCKC